LMARILDRGQMPTLVSSAKPGHHLPESKWLAPQADDDRLREQVDGACM
jgi:hypothetical protein